MNLGRRFCGVSDSVKYLSPHWMGDVETGFPARIKAIREDGAFLWYLPIDEVEQERDRLKAEVEKLRDMVRDLWACYGRQNCGCVDCDYFNVCDLDDPEFDECVWERRLREFGIESK